MRTFSPRLRPLNYDALHSDIGCQTIIGSLVGTVLPFTNECIYVERPDAQFLIPDSECRFLGPADHLAPVHPYTTEWCVWKNGNEVRVAELPFSTPTGPTIGDVSRLYIDGIESEKISAAFNRQGLIAYAAQKSLGTIQLRRYIDFTGTPQTIEFPGRDASLLYLGIGLTSEDELDSRIVCYYSRVEEPGVIFARFESDAYAIERRINPALRSTLAELKNVRWNYGRIELRGIDTSDRFVVLSTAVFALLSTDSIGIDTIIFDGSYFDAAVDGVADPESLTLGVTILSGVVSMDLAIVEDANGDEIIFNDDITLTTKILSGEYLDEFS